MFDQFKNKFPLDDEHWNDYISCFKQIEVPAKTVLLKEGVISKKLFLIKRDVSAFGLTTMVKT